MKKILYGVGVVVLVVGLYIWSSYNGLVSLNQQVTSQWSQVEVQYQRRVDLIPNLVASVKGIMKQEQAVFTALADARTHYAGAVGSDARAKAAGEVENALGRLLVITENYPQLKSSDTVQTLMSQLEGTENRVSVERKRYDDIVTVYNTKVQSFPGSVVASLFGFAPKTFFTAAAGADQAPTVSF